MSISKREKKTAVAPKATDGLTAAAHRFGPRQAKEGVKEKWTAHGFGKQDFAARKILLAGLRDEHE